jgi:Ala-tRNA(Pro) deacylase
MATTCRERLETYLREQQVPFQVQHHPLTFTAQQTAASEHIPGRTLAKVVMVLADGRLILLAVPAPARVDVAKAGALLGATDVRLAHEEEFARAFPDCEVGAMPLGNLYDCRYTSTRSRPERDDVFPAGTHTDTMSCVTQTSRGWPTPPSRRWLDLTRCILRTRSE